MGRKRQVRGDNKLPPYVTRVPSRNSVALRTYLGHARFGKTYYLKDKSGSLLPANASVQAIYEAYKHIEVIDNVRSLKWLFSEYFKTARYRDLADSTRSKYTIYSEALASAPIKSGGRFGDLDIAHITPYVIARYRDRWETDRRISVAREMQFMSAVFSWAVEQGYLTSNPAKGVRKPVSKPRDRYVTQAEFEAVKAHAKGSPYLAIVMELAYLCRARVGEVLVLQVEGDVKRKVAGVVDDGVYLKRSKGSDSEITLWTPRLEAAVEAAKQLHRDVVSPHLLHDRRGNAITYRATRSAFVRALEKADVDKFTLHDLKAAGISDHQDQAGGHRSARMRDVYVRIPSKVMATG